MSLLYCSELQKLQHVNFCDFICTVGSSKTGSVKEEEKKSSSDVSVLFDCLLLYEGCGGRRVTDKSVISSRKQDRFPLPDKVN